MHKIPKDHNHYKYEYNPLTRQEIRIPKRAYNSFRDALVTCKRVNKEDKQFRAARAYKCPTCGKYHLGRVGTINFNKI